MKMSENELKGIVDSAIQDAMVFNGTFTKENETYLKEYLGLPYGDEDSDRSSAVSNDVADVVESDMPTLARVFMGAGDIITFEANTENEAEIKEAEEKTKYINWIVRNQKESFTILHGWLKDAEIQKNGVVKYFIDESKEVETVKYKNVDQIELQELIESLEGSEVDKLKVDVEEQDEIESGTFNLTFRVTKERKKICIINVPPESFLITKNAKSLDDAMLVGDRIRKTRGELLADGFDKEIINQLPTVSKTQRNESTQRSIRNLDQGGAQEQDIDTNDWSGQNVELADLYIKVDYDGDGIAERRHVMRSGNILLINEPFAHVPYASLSAVLMPHKAIGRSRAEITRQYQKQKTALLRGLLDNTYMVNNPRNVVHPDVDLDDMLTVRVNGVVRLDDDTKILPQNAVFPLQIPYVGDKALQVLQYVDQAKAQTTGALLANQGLDSDAIGKETATRFRGVETASQAKIELVVRNYAETGFRKLYEGIAWLVSRFQDTPTEFRVLGKPFKANPQAWKYDHQATTSIGLGAGNNEKLVESLQGIYTIQQQLAGNGSLLVDSKDQYNTLKRIIDGLGLPNVNEFFNDPDQPDEVLLAENEQLKQVMEQLKAQVDQLQNPLAEAETIKQQGMLIKAQSDAQLQIAKLSEDQRQFNIETSQKQDQFNKDLATKITELELKFGQNIEGGL